MKKIRLVILILISIYLNQTIVFSQCPVITQQPVSVSTCLNVSHTVSFSVVATGSNLTYQWYLNGSPLTNTYPSSVNVTTNQMEVLEITPNMNGNNYSVNISSIGCSVTSNIAKLIGTNPGSAGTITGSSAVSPGETNVVYSVPAITNATGYTWTLPTGASIVSGNNTNTISVNFSTSAVSGNITVVGTNSCGSGIVSSNFPVIVCAIPAAAGFIAGSNVICLGQTGVNAVNYSVPPIANATGYDWILPTGATIVSGNNTNSIVVNYGLNATSGNITVQGTSCLNGKVSPNFNVTVISTLPVAAGTISGTNSICIGDTFLYSIPSIPNATSYIWNIPTGAEIIGSANYNTIQVTYLSSFIGGNFSVQGSNCYGDGTVSANFSVSKQAAPSEAGNISGPGTVFPGETNVTYSVPAIANAIGYIWSLPYGANIVSGYYTNTIIVNFSSSATSGNISVSGTNNCALGNASPSLGITVTNYPIIINQPVNAAVVANSNTKVFFSVEAIGNNLTYQWYANGSPLINSAPSSIDVTASTMEILEATSGMNGYNYYVLISSNGNSIFSNIAILTVNPSASSSLDPVIETRAIDSIDNKTLQSSDLIIYPNPAKNSITVKSNDLEIFNIKIISLTGIIVSEKENCPNNSSIDISGLPNGSYIIVVSGKSNSIVQKLIKD